MTSLSDFSPESQSVVPPSQTWEFKDGEAGSLTTQESENVHSDSRPTIADHCSGADSAPENWTAASQIQKSHKLKGGKRRSLDFYFSGSQKPTPTQTPATASSDVCAAGTQRECETGMKKKGFFARRQEQLQHKSCSFPVILAEKESDSREMVEKVTLTAVGSRQKRVIGDGSFDDESGSDDLEIINDESNSEQETDSKDSTFFHHRVTKNEPNSEHEMDSYFFQEHIAKKVPTVKQPIREPQGKGTGGLSQTERAREVGTSTSHLPDPDAAKGSNQSAAVNEVTLHNNRLAHEDLMTCDKCGQTLAVWEMPEHSDYHFAVELQETSEPPPAVPATGDSACGTAGMGGAKRKLPSGRGGRGGKGGKRGRPRKEVTSQSSNLLSFFTKE